MKVKDAMSTDLQVISPTATIKAAATKMSKYHIGSLIVTTAGFEIVGIITERDILRAFSKGKEPGTKIRDVMTKGVVTIEDSATLGTAADKMLHNGIKRLVVTRKGKCVGIVTATDLMTYESRLVEKLTELTQTPRKLMEAG